MPPGGESSSARPAGHVGMADESFAEGGTDSPPPLFAPCT